MKIITQSLVLILSFIFVFIFEMTPLSSLTSQILGLLIVAYFISSFRKKGKGFVSMGGEGPWGVFILNTLIFVLIFSTGSINSPLFFLLYFLGFGIAFVFEPPITFVFIVGAILVFGPDVLQNDLTNNLLKIGSLILISPLAFFFGEEYRRNLKEQEELEALEERTKDAADTISEDIEEVIKNEKQNLKEKDIEKLNEVLEETEDLRQEAKEK